MLLSELVSVMEILCINENAPNEEIRSALEEFEEEES